MNHSNGQTNTAVETDVARLVEARLARISRGILAFAVAVALLVMAVNIIEEGRVSQPMWMIASALPILVVLLGLVQRGHTKAAVQGLIGVIYLVIIAVVITRGTVRVPASSLIILAAAMSGLVLGRRSMIVMLAIGVLVVGGLAFAEAGGLLRTPVVGPIFSFWLAISMFAIATGAVLSFARGIAEDALIRASTEIAERRAADRALRESEARFRSLTELSSDWYWEQDRELRLSFHSNGFEQHSGTVSEKLLGTLRWEEFNRFPLSGTWEQHRAALEAHEPFRDFEYLRIGDDGKRHYLSISGVPIFDAAENFSGYRGVGTNITQRKQHEEALQRFRTAMDASGDALFIVDRTSLRYLDVNAAACAAVGLTREQMFARGPAGVLSMSREEVARIYDSVIAGGSDPTLTEKFRTRSDGREFWMEVRRTAQRSEEGWMIVTVARDITERFKNEVALRASEEKLRSLYEMSPLGIVLTDMNGRYVEFNEAFRNICGYPTEELKTLNYWVLTPKNYEADEARQLELLERTGHYGPYEKEYVRKDGSLVPLRLNGVTVTGGDGERYIWSIVEDITERKQAELQRAQLEMQLRESQKMEAIGTLAGGIAHDFNNLIATILGNTDLARQDASSNPVALESLDEIGRAARRARDLTQQILSFSRRQPTERKLMALAPIVDESVRLLRATLPARVKLDVHCAADVPCVLADATQIEQVLLNLASNASQATHGRAGRIRIRLDSVTVDKTLAETQPATRGIGPGRMVRLLVSDDGRGMDAATLDRIFEPFFTTKPVGEGTGLGLSVVHGIVKAHKGVITVESEPGKGTNVTLYFPVAEARAGAPKGEGRAAATDVAPAMGGGQRILYLDDDEALVFLVKRLLERRGFGIGAYTDQDEALTALRADPAAFDLMVSDYNMPGMSGLDVAREVRVIRSDLPVVVASGFIDEALREQAEGAGVRNLIFKANTAEDLCGAIARLAQTAREKSEPA